MAEPLQSALDPGLLLWPPSASTSAEWVDTLFFVLLGGSVLVTLVVAVLIALFCWRYRAGAQVRRGPGLTTRGAHRLEFGVAAAITVGFLAVFVWSATLYLQLYRPPPGDALIINVVGKQWMWKLQHPDGSREINTLHVPAHRKVRLRITSADVIHSFYVPAFRLKRDAVPGLYTNMWFETTKPGRYHLYCAEYCGTQHSHMRGQVVVMAPADYQAWLEKTGFDKSPAAVGQALFQAHGCSGCHRGDSVARAPSLAGIYGRPVPLAGGGTIIADEAYLRDSILLPTKHVVAGYAPVMPSFAGQISEAEILQIIAYIKSLDPGDWERGP